MRIEKRPDSPPLQGFKPVSGRHAQIRQLAGLIEQAQLCQCNGLNIRRQLAAPETRPDTLCLAIRKIPDHEHIHNASRYR